MVWRGLQRGVRGVRDFVRACRPRKAAGGVWGRGRWAHGGARRALPRVATEQLS